MVEENRRHPDCGNELSLACIIGHGEEHIQDSADGADVLEDLDAGVVRCSILGRSVPCLVVMTSTVACMHQHLPLAAESSERKGRFCSGSECINDLNTDYCSHPGSVRHLLARSFMKLLERWYRNDMKGRSARKAFGNGINARFESLV